MKKFYVINLTKRTTGIGAIIREMTKYCLFAIESGFVPIIDFKHNENQYFRHNRIYKDNSWEYFFEQPCGYTLDDIKDDDEVVVATDYQKTKKDKFFNDDLIPSNPQKIMDGNLKEIKDFSNEYIRFNKELTAYVEKEYNRIIGDKKDVLGVLIRGTDYTIRRSHNEPIQPKIKNLFSKIRSYLNKYPEISHIYLATEDSNIYSKFKEEFGDMILDNNQYRYSYTKNSPPLAEMATQRKDNNYHICFEYLSSIYILSKCKYFIGGLSAGTRFAWILQQNWEDFYIYKLGRYGRGFKEQLFSIVTKRRKGIDYRVYYILGIPFRKKVKV